MAADACLALGLVAKETADKQALWDEARKYAERGIQVVPQNYRWYLVFTEIERADGHPEKVLDWLRQGIKATEAPYLYWTLGRLLVGKHEFDEVKSIISALRKKDIPGAFPKFLKAQVEYVQGHWRAATELLLQVRLQLQATPAPAQNSKPAETFRTAANPALTKEVLFELGTSYEQLQDRERALEAYQTALKTDPQFVPRSRSARPLPVGDGPS